MPPSTFKTHVVESQKALTELTSNLKKQESFAVDLETTSLDTLEAEIVGISICFDEKDGYYIPTGHQEGKNQDLSKVLKALGPLLADEKIVKIGHNLKYDMAVFRRYDISVNTIWDTMLGGYLLQKGIRGHALDLGSLAIYELKYLMQPIEDLIGKKGKDQRTFDTVSIEDAAFYAAEDAVVTWRLKQKLEEKIVKDKLESVLYDIELPLVHVLLAMEQIGMDIDVEFLKKMSKSLGRKIAKLSDDIFAMSGEEFNLNSPKQMSEILFNKLMIPTKGLKKTKTGTSTAASELEKINMPITKKIGEYREFNKLKNTYVDALPEMVHPRTGRLHTHFNQAVAATGRLSSTAPALQNIPVRTETGREIRKAFLARRGYRLISADYSQIELRVLAHLSGDKELITAFKNGEDIHSKTASLVEKVPIDKVSSEMRRAAKVVNFGILYGLGPHRLSNETELSYEEAKQFIEDYFAGYPSVEKWIDGIKKDAYKNGYVETMFGRRRYIPELRDSQVFMRNSGERMAVNMPIQGTAADIMKMAMIQVHDSMVKKKLKANIVLQVHDELVIETPTKEVDAVVAILEKDMGEIAELAVPLTIDIAVGQNWKDLK